MMQLSGQRRRKEKWFEKVYWFFSDLQFDINRFFEKVEKAVNSEKFWQAVNEWAKLGLGLLVLEGLFLLAIMGK